MSRPQFYPNTLAPVEIDEESLRKASRDLQIAVQRGATLLDQNNPLPHEWGVSGIYFGVAGIALVYLRLARQAASLAEEKDTPPDFRKLADQRILPTGPDLPILPSRLSPMGSLTPLAAVSIRILSAAETGAAISEDDVVCLQEGIRIALKNPHLVPHNGRRMGGDEVLYGRTSLLWSILNIRAHKFDEKTRDALQPVFESIPKFVDVIVQGGRLGRRDHTERYGEKDAMPLMYAWNEGETGLGAVHGTSGIIQMLLACNPEELNNDTRNYLPEIAGTVSGLCKICIANNGHLPTTIPYRKIASETSHLVQACHGSPGMALLMACARRNAPLVTNFWEPEWDEAIRLATDRIWEEGLLPKGAGLCHGFVGNALPLIFLHDSFEYDGELMHTAKQNYLERSKSDPRSVETSLTGDYFLSRALAFILHGREAPPYKEGPTDYRLADAPYTLGEGIGGTVLAWADTAVAVQSRLRKMELAKAGNACADALEKDSVFQAIEGRKLGFVNLGHHKPAGLV